MQTLLKYAQTEQRSGQEQPLAAADALILAELAYLDFTGLVPSIQEAAPSAAATWPDLGRIGALQAQNQLPARQLFASTIDAADNRRLWKLVTQNPRFACLKPFAYCYNLAPEAWRQFAALSFLSPAGELWLTFRGTDLDLTGWREDFALSFMPEIPSQTVARDYARQLAGRWPQADLYLCGHSKGGNLAIFAAAALEPVAQDRVKAVYAFDSPGFLPDFFKTPGYRAVSHKLKRYVPQYSLVGQLLQPPPEPCQVVVSYALDGIQHNAFSWLTSGTDLARANELRPLARRRSQALQQQIAAMTREQRRAFTEGLYELGKAVETARLTVADDSWTKRLRQVVSSLRQADPAQRAFLRATLFALLRALRPPFPDQPQLLPDPPANLRPADPDPPAGQGRSNCP
ncbi:DUF2974 domain-containing protein [Oscillospiraceae bacterium HV4-5-C5C]|nr:DUF2974 domain-containing protein [Oscillospiraceae bacterium HV4-5-C5C]